MHKKNLLICEYRVIGDAIMTLPFIISAKDKYNIHVACTKHTKEIYKELLPNENIHSWEPSWFNKSKFLTNWFSYKTKNHLIVLKNLKFEISVCSWADTRTHYIMAKTKSAVRIGFPMEKINVIGSRFNFRKKQILIGKILNLILSIIILKPLLNIKLFRKKYNQHHVDDWKQIAEFLNIKWIEKRPWFNINKFKKNKKINNIFKLELKQSNKKWAIHPGGRVSEHRWPQEMFAKVIKEIFIPNSIQTMIIEPPNFKIINELKQLSPIVKTENLYDLLCLLSLFDGVLCNDTAISHASTAVGNHVITIFNAGNPKIFSPRGNEKNIVQKQGCFCHPCIGNCMVPKINCNHSISMSEINQKIISIMR